MNTALASVIAKLPVEPCRPGLVSGRLGGRSLSRGETEACGGLAAVAGLNGEVNPFPPKTVHAVWWRRGWWQQHPATHLGIAG